MAAPILEGGSINSIETTTTTASIASLALTAKSDRVLVMQCFTGGDSATTANVGTVVVDSAGVDSTLANGKVIRQGSRQLAKEGNLYTMIDIFFCLQPNLPSSAGNYKLDFTMDAAIGDHLWIAFEISGCPKQEYDNIGQAVVLADVGDSVDISLTLTPNDPDCLLVYAVGLNYSGFPLLSTSDIEITNLSSSSTNGGISSEFTQSGAAAAKTMSIQNMGVTTRHAKTIMSFSGVTPAAGGFKSYFAGKNNLLY